MTPAWKCDSWLQSGLNFTKFQESASRAVLGGSRYPLSFKTRPFFPTFDRGGSGGPGGTLLPTRTAPSRTLVASFQRVACAAAPRASQQNCSKCVPWARLCCFECFCTVFGPGAAQEMPFPVGFFAPEYFFSGEKGHS